MTILINELVLYIFICSMSGLDFEYRILSSLLSLSFIILYVYRLLLPSLLLVVVVVVEMKSIWTNSIRNSIRRRRNGCGDDDDREIEIEISSNTTKIEKKSIKKLSLYIKSD